MSDKQQPGEAVPEKVTQIDRDFAYALSSHFNGIYCDEAGLRMIAAHRLEAGALSSEAQARLEEAEWWHKIIMLDEDEWDNETFEEINARITALRAANRYGERSEYQGEAQPYPTGGLADALKWATQVANRIQREWNDGESLAQEHRRIERTLVEMLPGALSSEAQSLCSLTGKPHRLVGAGDYGDSTYGQMCGDCGIDAGDIKQPLSSEAGGEPHGK